MRRLQRDRRCRARRRAPCRRRSRAASRAALTHRLSHIDQAGRCRDTAPWAMPDGVGRMIDRHVEKPDRRLPHTEESQRAAGCAETRLPRRLIRSSRRLGVEMAADAARRTMPNSAVFITSSERGRGRSTATVSAMRPGPRRHHQHAVGEEHRLGDRMGDEHHGLAPLEPDALQLDVHLLARHARRARRTARPSAAAPDRGSARARCATRCCMPPDELPGIALLEAAETDQRQQIERALRHAARARGAARRPAAARCRARCARETAPATGTPRRCRGAVR